MEFCPRVVLWEREFFVKPQKERKIRVEESTVSVFCNSLLAKPFATPVTEIVSSRLDLLMWKQRVRTRRRWPAIDNFVVAMR